MAQLVAGIVHKYHDVLDNQSDPRVNDWSMMESPLPTIAICLSYGYISRVIGPRLMENRKPFQLRTILIAYNCVQTIFSAWIFYEGLLAIAIEFESASILLFCMSGWMTGYSYRCQPVDYSDSPQALRMARTCWWYYISKFTEFFDTFFFIMRKKTNQVSNLHVIHHGIMPFSVWLGLKFAPGGHSTFFSLLNAFVHIVMYFYYMLSAMGPQYQKFLWWKKYLTTFQMVQFIAIMVHQGQLLFTDCNFPKSVMVWIFLHGVLFFFLFSDFYKRTYNSKGTRQRDQSTCMPVEDDSPRTTPAPRHQFEENNEYSKVYTNCYTDAASNGYIGLHTNGVKKKQ